jgi:hypothetical protein
MELVASDEEHEDQLEISNSAVEQVSCGIQWIKRHPVLAAVVWMFGGADNATDYYRELVVQAKNQGTSSVAEDYSDDIHYIKQNSKNSLDFHDHYVQKIVKRLSWSDQHGQTLVQFVEEKRQSVSAPAILYTQRPIKSALKISQSCQVTDKQVCLLNSTLAPPLHRDTLAKESILKSGVGEWALLRDYNSERCAGEKHSAAGVMQCTEIKSENKNTGSMASLNESPSPQWGWYVNVSPVSSQFCGKQDQNPKYISIESKNSIHKATHHPRMISDVSPSM